MKNMYVFIFLIISAAVYSQNISDALRYSFLNPSGSARSVAVGGSMDAIGADFNAIGSNPAGLSSFRFSEIAFTPSFYINQTKSTLSRTIRESSDNKFGGSIDHLGLVLVRSKYEGAKWRYVNFSIGFNKLADFNNQFYFDGANTGSITDHWRERALRIAPDDLDDFGSGLAYETGAIFDSNNDNIYESDFINQANVPVHKSQFVNRRGGLSELQFGLAGTYKDVVSLGLSVGIPMLTFTEDKTYEEQDPLQNNPVFEKLSYTEYLKTEGSGVNLKLGAIFKLHKSFRLGLSFQTPTLFELDDTYETGLSYSYTDKGTVNTYDKKSPQLGQYTYNLITPMRARASFGSVIGKAGFVSAGMEYVNYSKSQFDFVNGSSDDITYQNSLNQEINKQYQATLNYHVGGEVAVDDFRLRGGIKLLGSPYDNDNDLTQVLSAGIGYRSGKFFMDAAVQHMKFDDGYLPYTTSSNDLQLVNNEYLRNRLSITVGVKF